MDGEPRDHLGVYGLGGNGWGLLVVRHGARGAGGHRRRARRSRGRGGGRRGGMDTSRCESGRGALADEAVACSLVPRRHLASAWAVRSHVPRRNNGRSLGASAPWSPGLVGLGARANLVSSWEGGLAAGDRV